MVLTPGVAWDGYADRWSALAPQCIGLDLFADFQDDTAPMGVPVEVWLRYRELPASRPASGFSCPDDDLHARIVESYRIEVRPSPVGPTITPSASRAGRSRRPRRLSTFDAARPPLFDESVPAQAFPTPIVNGGRSSSASSAGARITGQPGRLIKRTDADRNATRCAPAATSASSPKAMFAADGVLRLRDRRGSRPIRSVNFKPPVVVAAARNDAVNDLVWCEGHLRVVGDTRLQGASPTTGSRAAATAACRSSCAAPVPLGPPPGRWLSTHSSGRLHRLPRMPRAAFGEHG